MLPEEPRSTKSAANSRKRWLRAALFASYASWGILCVSVGVDAFLVPSFDEVGHLDRGCYLTDALWLYVRCVGFPGASAVGSLLSIPWALLLGPVLLVFNPVLAIAAWSLLLFPVYYIFDRRRQHRRAEAA